MNLMIAVDGGEPVEADDGVLAGSPHRQIWHTLLALPVGATIVLTVPNDQMPIVMPGSEPIAPPPFTVTTYHTVDEEQS